MLLDFEVQTKYKKGDLKISNFEDSMRRIYQKKNNKSDEQIKISTYNYAHLNIRNFTIKLNKFSHLSE